MYFADNLSDAIALIGLCAGNPGSELISKILKGILQARKNGVWANTQENCWCSLAVYTYFKSVKFIPSQQTNSTLSYRKR